MNIAYLKDVKHQGERISYKVSGDYIYFGNNIKDVHITYAGIPMDSETGYVLVPFSSAKACRLYCIKNLLFEDYLAGKVHGYTYQQIERDMFEAIHQAQASLDDMDVAEEIEIMKIMNNMVFKVGEFPESLL